MKEGMILNIMDGYKLTPESTPSVLQHIGQTREQKGISELLIPQIDDVYQQAEKMGDFTTAIVLSQEKLLCAQHLVMENKKNPQKILKGLSIMKSTMNQMISLQKDNVDTTDPVVNARSFRFLGRLSDTLHQYPRSEKFYRQGLEFFEPLERIDQRYQSLELSGFLAFSLLKQGKDGWFDLTQQTLNDFDNSDEGLWLKNHDYKAWAIWKSGIEIRISSALINSKKLNEQYNGNVESWLSDADAILQINGNREEFGFRMQELKALTQEQNKL